MWLKQLFLECFINNYKTQIFSNTSIKSFILFRSNVPNGSKSFWEKFSLPPDCDLLNETLLTLNDENHNTTDSNSTLGPDQTNFYQLDSTKLYLLSVIILLTILGNFSVVVSILMRRWEKIVHFYIHHESMFFNYIFSTKVTRMYFFILHLSIADILTAFFTLLPEFAWTLTFPQFYGGNAMCKIVKIFQSIGPYLSSYTLVMTAVDRYQVSLLQNLIRSVQKWKPHV